MKMLITVLITTIIMGGVFLYPEHKERVAEFALRKSVVKVLQGNRSGGTGFLIEIDSEPYIMSNAHVCGDSKRLNIKRRSKSLGYFPVVFKDRGVDLCLIKLNSTYGLRPIPIAISLAMGEDILTVGHPNLGPLISFRGKPVFKNVVMIPIPKSMKCEAPYIMWGYRCVLIYNVLQSTLFSYSGQSGSPVVNMDGELVAVVFITHGGLIPLEYIKQFIHSFQNPRSSSSQSSSPRGKSCELKNPKSCSALTSPTFRHLL